MLKRCENFRLRRTVWKKKCFRALLYTASRNLTNRLNIVIGLLLDNIIRCGSRWNDQKRKCVPTNYYWYPVEISEVARCSMSVNPRISNFDPKTGHIVCSTFVLDCSTLFFVYTNPYPFVFPNEKKDGTIQNQQCDQFLGQNSKWGGRATGKHLKSPVDY